MEICSAAGSKANGVRGLWKWHEQKFDKRQQLRCGWHSVAFRHGHRLDAQLGSRSVPKSFCIQRSSFLLFLASCRHEHRGRCINTTFPQKNVIGSLHHCGLFPSFFSNIISDWSSHLRSLVVAVCFFKAEDFLAFEARAGSCVDREWLTARRRLQRPLRRVGTQPGGSRALIRLLTCRIPSSCILSVWCQKIQEEPEHLQYNNALLKLQRRPFWNMYCLKNCKNFG